MADVKPIPDGYPRVSPYLCVDGAAAAIDFYKAVFGATHIEDVPPDELARRSAAAKGG